MSNESSWTHDDDVLVHIGLPKTGTTAVQAALAAARPRLTAQGVLYPGVAPSQWNQAYDLTGLRAPHHWGEPDPHDGRDTWASLVREITSSPHRRCVISAECLTWASPEQIDRLTRDLGSVRVLITVRALEQLLPSAWQEDLKRGLDLTFEHWLDTVFVQGQAVNNRLSNPETFDIPAIIERWADRVGLDRVAISVVPLSGDATTNDHTSLDHLETLLGLVPGTLESTGRGDRNRGLTNAEAEILRRVNLGLDKTTMTYAHYRDRLRRPVIEELGRLREPTASESRVTMPSSMVERCRQVGRRQVAAIEDMGVMVVGDLADLVADGPIPSAPDEPAGPAVADAAAHIVHELIRGAVPEVRTHPVLRWLPPVCVPAARRVRDRVARLRRRMRGAPR